MTQPNNTTRQPERAKGAKSGLKPGEGAPLIDDTGGKRPVDEEDVFGGAERAQNEDVKSEKAKP